MAGRGQRQPDVGVGRQGQGAKNVRGQEVDRDVEGFQRFGEPLQRVDDAIDLRAPGVGDHQYAHSGPLQERSTIALKRCLNGDQPAALASLQRTRAGTGSK